MMNMYFDKKDSAKFNYGNDTKEILAHLIQRFIGANPEIPYIPIVDFPSQQPYTEDGWCMVSFDQVSQNLALGEKAVATTYVPSENARNIQLQIVCVGPTQVYINGEHVFTSLPHQENRRMKNSLSLSLNKGWNQLTIITEKTPLGCGIELRNEAPQWDPTHFYQKSDYFLPVLGFQLQRLTDISEQELFNEQACQLIKDVVESSKEEQYLIKLDIPWNCQQFIYSGGGTLQYSDGTPIVNGQLAQTKTEGQWLNLTYIGKQLSKDLEKFQWFEQCSAVNWIYCGPVNAKKIFDSDFSVVQEDACGEAIYWKAPLKDAHIRLARNSSLFAHWTYWMGVTLYGFFEASEYFSEERWKNYSLHSVEQIVKHDTYGQWDKENYHYPLINTQFYWLRELDDCGSFGSLLLESLHYEKDKRVFPIAQRIANFMEKRTLRQPDGAFFRENDTMWVDDLYMSVPFLVRYWEISQNEIYLTDAINQMVFFRKRFFIEENQLMSHIYDTRFKQANVLPWSRGNGWVLFSLSELLNKLPATHERRAELLAFYNEFSAGIIAQQDTNGLWHQLLDDKETYYESSSTAMFICALSRGIQKGYLSEELLEKSQQSVMKAWEGLAEYCIDKNGNLYGVCRGSGFSFSREYYHGLGWLLNDAHGTGIVALAGVEYERMKKTMNRKSGVN
ncbi:glycoside hydrolase family 88/105 protein [Enterococcus phoeniculicola]|jgi:unsaturated rhamnogalacturonyl hydrolase|nr:glycoside hydrolase family 88 protein [Enterococcus phoeniculicola]